MAKKSKKSLMELLHEEEEKKSLFNEAEAEGNNDKESENAETGTTISGDVKDAEPEQTADPVKASDEILATLNDYKSELPADLLTGGPEFDAKPRKRGRRSKAEIEKEKAEQAAAIVVPPELFVFVCDHGTAHAFALIDNLSQRKESLLFSPNKSHCVKVRPKNYTRSRKSVLRR